MAIRSMTGFGAAQASSDGLRLVVECRSVNHRGLDVRAFGPRNWGWLEPFVLNACRERAHRGRLDVRVEVLRDSEGGAPAVVDVERFAAIARELSAAAKHAGIEAAVGVSDVLAFRDAVGVSSSPDVAEPVAQVFRDAIETALDELVENRAREGGRLLDTMLELLGRVEVELTEIEDLATALGAEYRSRMGDRMAAAMEQFGIAEIDESRVLQEVALYVDRSDVSEELQRATSHVGKLRALLTSDAGEPCGKQIDFYLQELFREANTTGSKSGAVEITDRVVRMKTSIEQMREQAANIE